MTARNDDGSWSEEELIKKRARQAARREGAEPGRFINGYWQGIITKAEYIRLYRKRWKQQKGLCAICSRSVGRLRFDHCHRTLIMRGLLCVPCNTSLGWYEKYTTEIHAYMEFWHPA